MPAAPAEAGSGAMSRELYQFWGDSLVAAVPMGPGINGLAVSPVTL